RVFRNQANWFFAILSPYRIPERVLERVLKDIIRLTYENIGYSPEKDWSEWEDLGGYLTAGPSATVLGRNQLDVYVRGRNRVLYHRIWNGSSWTDWENLGGTLTSSPAAVSWRSEEHTSELQSRENLVCRLLL